MNTQSETETFRDQVRQALASDALKTTMNRARSGFVDHRAHARANFPEFDQLRDVAREMKDHTLQHLDLYLDQFEQQTKKAGGHVHWAENAVDACDIVLDICTNAGAKTVSKGKSMVSEEIGLNHALIEAGLEVTETDLGEYIIQLRGETPSHIIAPALHVSKDQIKSDFLTHHTQLDRGRKLTDIGSIVREARKVLRKKYFEADVGITGANILIAETGQSVIVTNEGNGDLTQSLANTHIVIASLEKVVPTLDDASTVLRLLARSATGQPITVYTTFSSGPRREDDIDGPQAYHVVLVDNGRSRLIGSEFQEALRCIKCGACMNHCPVYQTIGGHAYGSVYPGPIGAVITPALKGLEKTKDLPNASTFCGRCEAVCPMQIPLPDMMRRWREREFERHLASTPTRYGLWVWAFFARRPKLYHRGARWANWLLRTVGYRKGRIARFPAAGAWTRHRDLPTPNEATFMSQWAKTKRSK